MQFSKLAIVLPAIMSLALGAPAPAANAVDKRVGTFPFPHLPTLLLIKTKQS